MFVFAFTSVIVDSEEDEGQLLAGVQRDNMLHRCVLQHSINSSRMSLLFIASCLLLLAAAMSAMAAQQIVVVTEHALTPRTASTQENTCPDVLNITGAN